MITAVASVVLAAAVIASRLEPCEDSRLAVTPLCDLDLSLEERAEGFVRLLSLKEKVQQLGNVAPAIDRLGLPPYQWWNEALHGVLHDCIEGRCPTSYPAPLALAATFSMDLIEKVAEQISTEARAIHKFSDGQYGLQVWTPNINIYKDPRWGRGQETPGECVYLTSQYAIRYIRGIQGAKNPIPYPKLFATVKHFAVYNEETKRNKFNAIVSDTDLHQTFLPAFETSIVEGRAGSVMCSYNAVNGIPACANSYLLKDHLRDAWKFDGFVVSDCDAVGDISSNHHFVNNSAQGSAAALQSGVDLDCGDSYLHLEEAVNQALVGEELVDRALKRLLIARLRLGQFDPTKSQIYNQISLDVVNSNQHRQTARQAARESLVLLKNEGAFLPLRADSISSALITGPHALTTSDLCSNYIGQLPRVISIGQGIKNALPSANVTIIKGCGMTQLELSETVSAIKTAESLEYTIVALGLDQTQETETNDRKHIDLPGYQLEFLQEIAKVTSNIVLIIIGGGSIDLTWAKSSPAVKAIIYGFYPGEETGNAVADLILGIFSPNGRLPITLYERSYVDQVDMTSMEMSKWPGKTYRFYTGLPVYPFGFGLTYAEFSLEWLSTPSNGNFKISIQNIGSQASDFSALAFFKMEDNLCPKRQLFAIEKLSAIEPGEKRSVEFKYDLRQTYCVDKNGIRVAPKDPVIIQIENLQAQVETDQHKRPDSQTDITNVAILPLDVPSETT